TPRDTLVPLLIPVLRQAQRPGDVPADKRPVLAELFGQVISRERPHQAEGGRAVACQRGQAKLAQCQIDARNLRKGSGEKRDHGVASLLRGRERKAWMLGGSSGSQVLPFSTMASLSCWSW